MNYKKTTPSKINLHVPQSALSFAKSLTRQAVPTIALSIDSISPLKHYTEWAQVIELLKRSGFHIILPGKKHFELPEEKEVINLTAKTNIQTLKAVICTFNFFIGTDGLNSNLALAFNIPSVILFAVIDP